METHLIRYGCHNCGRFGCKLWRPLHILHGQARLSCFMCIPNFRIRSIDEKGTFAGEKGTRTYQLNNMVPAIPYPDFTKFWEFMVIPPGALFWWQNLRS